MSKTQATNKVDTQFLPENKEIQFQGVVRAFEKQEWAKGVKLAEPLHEEFPENGKIISIMSILQYNIDHDADKAEAGLKRGMILGRRTSLCWHLYGIFQRSRQKYVEAKKSFQFAHSLDPTNIQIIIDLGDLQVQIGDYAGYRTTKQKLISERSGEPAHWLGFIMGAYLDAKYDLCIDIITTFRDSLDKGASYIRQELAFIEADCYNKKKEWKKAIDVLTKHKNEILYEERRNEKIACYYGILGDLKKSEAIWRDLLRHNSDNIEYYRGLECCILNCWSCFDSLKNNELISTTSVTEDQRKQLLDLYTPLAEQFPRSLLIPHIQLYLKQGDAFETAMNAMIMKSVRKGIPSLFNTIQPLFSDKQKYQVVKTLAENHMTSLQSQGTLYKSEIEEEPFVFVWLSLLLAQLADYEHNTTLALTYLDKAIDHTPTCYDLYVYKAKVLRHAGALRRSADMMKIANEMDLADRYMNTKRVKALLRCNCIEEADHIVSYWTRKDVPNRIELNMLQACWFELACADAYFRIHDIPHAYKLYHAVLDHFTTFVQDQFDFHQYVLRKAVLTTYADFLHTVKQVYRKPYYHRAAIGAIRCVLELVHSPLDEEEYKKTHTLMPVPVHKKGAEFTDDKDADGLVLCSKQNTLDCLKDVIMELMLYANDDAEAMRAVFEWAKEKGDTNLCTEAITNLRESCHLPLDALYEEEQLNTVTHPIDLQTVDKTSLHNRVILCSLMLLKNPSSSIFETLTSEWETLQRPSIEDCLDAFRLLQNNDQHHKDAFVTLVKKFYSGFEETVQYC